MDDRNLAGVERAIEAVGGVAALAAALGISHVSVIRWRERGVIPASRVAAVEAVTRLPRAVLRPDLFGAPAGGGFAETQAPLAREDRAPAADPSAEKARREAEGWARARRWAEENREAIEAWNRYFEENDTPLAQYRMF